MHRLSSGEMVHWLPPIKHQEHLCDACLVAKQRRAPFPCATEYRATEPLELLHGDLCGPVSPPTPGGKGYIMLIVDDMSRYMWAALLQNKSDAEAAFKRLRAGVEKESGRSLRAFRTDRGGEFASVSFFDYCDNAGIKRHLTTPYSPQQNGIVELLALLKYSFYYIIRSGFGNFFGMIHVLTRNLAPELDRFI